MDPLKIKINDDEGGVIEVTLIAQMQASGEYGEGFVGFRTHTHEFIFITVKRLLRSGKFQRWVTG